MLVEWHFKIPIHLLILSFMIIIIKSQDLFFPFAFWHFYSMRCEMKIFDGISLWHAELQSQVPAENLKF